MCISANGTELACHEEISNALNADIYFTHPYSAWEKGRVENMNKLIREYIPKNDTFCDLDDEKLKEIQEKINNRPRKKLGYYTSNEKFEYIKQSCKVAFIR